MFEHLEWYFTTIPPPSCSSGLRDCVQLVLAPLTQTEVASGESYSTRTRRFADTLGEAAG